MCEIVLRGAVEILKAMGCREDLYDYDKSVIKSINIPLTCLRDSALGITKSTI